RKNHSVILEYCLWQYRLVTSLMRGGRTGDGHQGRAENFPPLRTYAFGIDVIGMVGYVYVRMRLALVLHGAVGNREGNPYVRAYLTLLLRAVDWEGTINFLPLLYYYIWCILFSLLYHLICNE